jgi:single-strand DNA-binding protein
MIKMQAIGHLGKDCTVNNVNGKTVINFSVAHTEKYKDAQGNQQEKTTWVDCSWWSDRTTIAPYLKKGTQVYVEGSPEVRTFAKNDGTTGASLSLRVQAVQLLGSKDNGPQNGQQTQPVSNRNAVSDIPQEDFDLPF